MIVWIAKINYSENKIYALFPHPVTGTEAWYVAPLYCKISCMQVRESFGRQLNKKKIKEITQ